MRPNVRASVEQAAKSWPLSGPIYEFGSYLVEGQNDLGDLRRFFGASRYVGCDMRSGLSVDRIEDLARLKLASDSARTIICVDTLEHVFEVRRGGGRNAPRAGSRRHDPVGGTAGLLRSRLPQRLLAANSRCMTRLLSGIEGMIVGWQGVENYPHTVYGIGCKGPLEPAFAAGSGPFIEGMQAWLAEAERSIPWHRKLKRWTVGRPRSKKASNGVCGIFIRPNCRTCRTARIGSRI